MRIEGTIAFNGALLVGALLAACSTSPPYTEPPAPGPGVIFTYPESGQFDVPVGTRITVTLSDPVQGSPTMTCTPQAGGMDTGGICLVGPTGSVDATLDVGGPNGNVIHVQPTGDLAAGQTYSLYVPASVLGSASSNLPASGPLFQFTTRQQAPIPGAAATVVSINGESPSKYTEGGSGPSIPFITFMSVRLVFSEPVDPTSFILGKTFRFVEVGSGGVLTDVPGQLFVKGIHLTFNPSADLDPGGTYQVLLQSGLVDEGGEPLTSPATWTFQPQGPSASGTTYPQTLAVTPAGTASGPPSMVSSLSGEPANSLDLHSPLVGVPVLSALSGAIASELGDPSAFGGPIPLTIRAGQRLDLSPLTIEFGGALATPYGSGTMHMIFLTDANGVIRRNLYRPATTSPDDQRAPVAVDFTFDTLVFSDDPMGNVLSTQTLFGVQMTGTSVTSGTSLAIETLGALEFSALGAAAATGNASFRLQTQPGAALTAGRVSAPTLVASSPYAGQTDFPTTSHLVLFFSVPIDFQAAQMSQAITLTDSSSHAVPFSLQQDGATLVVIPSAPLAIGSSYTLGVGALTDVEQQPVTLTASSIAFQTEAATTVVSTAPFLTALSPGAPCALEGGGPTNPGHCLGGQSGDMPYQPFTASGDQHVVARFSQPMLRSSMVLGTQCGQGTVRIEAVDSSGKCIAPVPGTLTYVERGFDFVPAQLWQVGKAFQITLSAGQDPDCMTGGICSALIPGRSLNAAPLNGIADTLLVSRGGGVDVVIPFSGIAPQPATHLTMGTVPFSDLNGDGAVDGPEVIQDPNRLSVALTNTGGFIESSSQILGTPCDASSAPGSVCENLEQFLPITVKAAIASCPVDSNGSPTTMGGPCVPSRLSPQTIELTGMAMNVNTNLITSISLDGVPTGMLLMRLLEPTSAGITGYMVDAPGSSQTQFVVTTNVYIDAPDLVLAGGLATHNLHSYPSQVILKGPVTFLPDGRFQVSSVNLGDITLNVQSTALGFTGTMTLDVPAGELHLTLAGEPIK